MPIGRHMPLDARPLEALTIAKGLGCESIQIFVSNPRGWASPVDDAGEVMAFANALKQHNFAPIVIHAAYLINLASATEATRQRSCTLLRWTMARGQEIGADYVVMHTGSHGGDGMASGIARMVEGIVSALDGLPAGPRLLLENDVGAGHTIGSHFDAMAQVLDILTESYQDRLGICLDTAHLWGAGHDISTPDAAHAVLDQIDAALGLAKVQVIHLNDTEVPLGSHRDHHQRLGEGIIPSAGLRALLRDTRLAQAAIILETPICKIEGSEKHDWEDDRRRVAYARQLVADDEVATQR